MDKSHLLPNSVPDPNPDPPDQHVFWPSGSGSISQSYGSGSGSDSGSGFFYQKAKIVRKTLFATVLCLLLDFLSLKNDENVPSNSNKKKNLKMFFCLHLEGQ
jgi:hypothetical protein